jgi:hypothetical protein
MVWWTHKVGLSKQFQKNEHFVNFLENDTPFKVYYLKKGLCLK